MKLSVIALDYDGTIARDGVLEPSVRDAIEFARRQGIAVLVVTGRMLSELRRVAGGLHVFDGVVAENGAVMYLPASERSSALAPQVPHAFIEELRGRGVPFSSGECLVDAAARDASRLLEVIRELEVPLALIFNRGQVMALPHGVSKASGLQVALQTLRLSARNTLAVGDAENDHELLRLAEVGVAVEWGSPALQAAADVTLAGRGPEAVADYVRQLATTGVLPSPVRARRRLLLGHLQDGSALSLAVRGRNVLVAGDVRSGKSCLAGLLCEQLILHGYCVCIIDPEGDYGSLEALPGVTILGRDDPPPTPRELLRALRYPDRSIVIDLSRLTHADKVHYVRGVLPTLNVLRRRTGLPHRIVLDEAHYYLDGAGAEALLDFECNGYTVVTYCPSRLPQALVAAAEVMLMTRQSNTAETAALRAHCGDRGAVEPGMWASVTDLPLGAAVALPVTEEASGQLQRFTVGKRLTPHVRHWQKYVDVPVSADRAFVFHADGQPLRRVRTLRAFVAELEARPAASLTGYARRRDFSRWIGDVFGDGALANELQALEHGYGNGRDAGAPQALARAVRARYDLGEAKVEAGPRAPAAGQC